MPRPLGTIQVSMLAALKRHRSWYSGCGWLWDTVKGTERILDSLVRRGLVVRTQYLTGRVVYKKAVD
jgi:hypothetical protein